MMRDEAIATFLETTSCSRAVPAEASYVEDANTRSTSAGGAHGTE